MIKVTTRSVAVWLLLTPLVVAACGGGTVTQPTATAVPVAAPVAPAVAGRTVSRRAPSETADVFD